MKKILTILITALLVFGQISIIFAQNMPPLNPSGDTVLLPGSSGEGTQDFLQSRLIPNITNIVIGLTGGLSLLFVILGGIQILTAYGNDERLGAGKQTLTWAIGGLVISILSYAIVQIIVSIQF